MKHELFIKTNFQKESNLTSFFLFTSGFLIHSESELSLSWHNQVEIIRILEGEGVFNVSGSAIRVRANSFIVINPNQIHSAQATMGRPLRYQSLKFKYDFFKTYDEDPMYQLYVLPLLQGVSFLPTTIIPAFPIHKLIVSLFDSVSDTLIAKEKGYEIEIKIFMLQLLHIFYNNKFVYKRTTEKKLKQSEDLTRKAISYIHSHYSNTIPLDQMSELFETSKPHLCRTFKRMTGQTITEYHNTHRINIACELLLTTDLSISDISADVGYKNLSYFNQRFKQKTFLTPVEYRQAKRKET